MIRKLQESIGVVVVGGLACVGLSEAAEFSRPSQPVCDERPQVSDFGPPEGCTDVPGPHPRSGRVATLTVSASSTATIPLFAFDVYYADEAAAPVDQRSPPFSLIAPSTSAPVNSVTLYTHVPVFVVEPGKWPPRQVR
jgi:hypothetical protein